LHAVAQFVACHDQVWQWPDILLLNLLYWWLDKALAVAGKNLFHNCLVAMKKSKAVCLDMPSTHNVTTYIHNQFVMWLQELKTDILVSMIKQ
jgi:hypothetical protein